VSTRVPDRSTPCLLVDVDVLAANVERMARHAVAVGARLRPHAKTHKSAAIARLQRDAGAIGFTVATLREAEALATAGFDDLLLAGAALGPDSAARLRRLREVAQVSQLVDGIDGARAAGTGAPCLWEVDIGAQRAGTAPGSATIAAAAAAVDATGIVLVGVLTFPGHAYGAGDDADLDRAVHDEQQAVGATVQAAAAAGVTLGVRSGGSTPTAWRAQAAGPLTELRPGNYVFHDATQVALGVCSQAQCALRVLATVVSRPTPQRVVLDAGSKALGRERMTPRTPGYGLLLGDHAPLPVGALYEEHAIVEAPAGTRGLPRVGDRVELLPNHACVTANLHDRYVLRRGEEVVDVIAVDARGWG
jgi:D-serine deaminase-like pyridoxal phosphate-dependent protein